MRTCGFHEQPAAQKAQQTGARMLSFTPIRRPYTTRGTSTPDGAQVGRNVIAT